jgi:hypothetical protein
MGLAPTKGGQSSGHSFSGSHSELSMQKPKQEMEEVAPVPIMAAPSAMGMASPQSQAPIEIGGSQDSRYEALKRLSR